MNTAAKRIRLGDEEIFGRQPSRTSELPDPEPLLRNLARCVVEILSGARELEQISRWLDESVYITLLKRTTLARLARRNRQEDAMRPSFAIGSMLICEPRDGIVEATIMVHARHRSRVVAIRLEGFDHRWYATSITIP